jgi:hypothetical protein
VVVATLPLLLVCLAGPGAAAGGESTPMPKVRTDPNPKPAGWVAADQAAAIGRAHTTPAFVDEVLIEDLPLRQQRLRRMGLDTGDIEHSYLWLASPFVNTYEDTYASVRFMHSRHAARNGGLLVLPPERLRPRARGEDRSQGGLPPAVRRVP